MYQIQQVDGIGRIFFKAADPATVNGERHPTLGSSRRPRSRTKRKPTTPTGSLSYRVSGKR